MSELKSAQISSKSEQQDKFKDECGLMAVWNHAEAANLTYLGLYAQQHRGQEGAGVVSLSSTDANVKMHAHRGLGLVADVFDGFDFRNLPGPAAIGHVRYTTAGGQLLANVQPFSADSYCGPVAIAHNGNLINTDPLREELVRNGALFSGTSDTEVILHQLARSRERNGGKELPLVEMVIDSLKNLRGAYSLLLLFKDRLFAIRDPNGFRPLSIGSLGDAVVVASETCAFDLIGADFVRDVSPGEIVEILTDSNIRSYFPFPIAHESACIFEYVYFARPDSNVFGRNVYQVRRRLGRELAKECPVQADFVVPVPDSGVTAALGYAEESNIPLELGLIRNHYVGRTFIEPMQSIRDFGVKIKHNANSAVLKGKRIVVVDDSIVRGTTSKKLVAMLREAGATEIHMRISAPPTIDPCYYGIDTPKKQELIAAKLSIAEVSKFLEVDSLAYLSLEGLHRAVNALPEAADQSNRAADQVVGAVSKQRMCDACFSGNYPAGTPEDFKRRQARLL